MKLKARIATIFEIAGNRQDGRGRAATPAVSRGAKGTGARRSRSLLALLATLFASVALLLGVVVPAADAATATDSYGYLASFGSGHYGTFQTQYNAVTVDGSTGNVLVGEDRTDFTPEGPGQRVLVYSPDPTAGGTLLTTLDVGPTNYYPNSVAVDQSDGALYLWSDFGSVHRFLSDGAPVPTYTEDLSYAPAGTPSGPPGGMAVDSVNHEVLAAGHEPQRVYRYGPTGALIGSFDGSNTAGGVFKEVVGLAVGPTGTVYVVDNTRVEEFNTAGASLGKLPISAGGAPSTVAVNPQSGEVAVAVARHGQNYLEGFTAAGVPTFSSRLPAQAGGGPAGLAWDAGTDRIYLNTTSGLVHTLIPAKQPGVDPPTISQVTPTSAHIEAKVAPGGEAGETTTARIEYCPATAPCGEYPVSNTGESNPWVRLTEHETLEATEDVPLGSGEKKIADDLTGLAPNTSYLVRASADRTSAGNVPTYNTSASVPLDTPLIPPDVQTNPAGAVTTSQALLSGTINTYGDQTTFHFEYGLTTNYGAGVPAGAEGVAGSERAPRTFTRTVTGLQPGTTYHYRLVAHNAAGTTAGIDRTFTTMGVDEVAPGRGYEQVTQVDKRGATLSPEGFQAAADGSAIAYRTASPSTDSEGAPLFPRYLSRRGASDWSDWQPLDPPANVWRGVVAHAVHAVSADFTHAMVVSNRALAPGAIENAANIYIVDLQTGAYSLVGSVKGIDPYLHFNGLEPANSYLAGAPDFSWIVLASADPLLEGVTAPALYKWTEEGGLEVVSRLPGPKPGSVPSGGMPMVTKDVLTRRQTSDDGDTLYFSLGGPDAGVYRRAGGETTAISVSQIPGDPTTPMGGEFDGTSRDGRYAFFTSERLTSDAPALPAEPPSSTRPADLYQYDSLTGNLTYVGQSVNAELHRFIGISDDGQTAYYNAGGAGTVVWRNGVSHTVTTGHPDNASNGMEARLSENGRFLAYMENGDVYVYDADTDQNACASCRADGSPGTTADPKLGPAMPLRERDLSNRAAQVVTDSGMVFFDTTLPLLPADHNATRDVYAYQGGKLTLISPGDGDFNATFADASADGSNIYFTTDEPLVGQDTDGALDLYDARIGGGFAAQSPRPPASCARNECAEADSGPLSSPPVGSSASQSQGKPRKRCAQGTHARKVGGKTRCVKSSKAKKNAKRANTNRRQGR